MLKVGKSMDCAIVINLPAATILANRLRRRGRTALSKSLREIMTISENKF